MTQSEINKRVKIRALLRDIRHKILEEGTSEADILVERVCKLLDNADGYALRLYYNNFRLNLISPVAMREYLTALIYLQKQEDK